MDQHRIQWGKSNELSADVRKRIVDLYKSEMSLGDTYEQLQIPKSSVQSIVPKYKCGHPAEVRKKTQTVTSAERTLVWMVRNNPETIEAQAYHQLEASVVSVWLSTVRPVSHSCGPRGCRPRKKRLLRYRHLQDQLKFAADQMEQWKASWRKET